MTRAESVAARLGHELADYLYPVRDWMIDSKGCDADVAIIGSGRRAHLLSYALRRERITRQLLLADPVVDLVEMYGALGEPRTGLPHLDLAGTEFWIPDAGFGAWLSGWDEERKETPAGAALRASWADYLGWLAGLFEVPTPASPSLAAIELEADRVRLVQSDGTSRTARRLVLAGPAADLDRADPRLAAGLAPKALADASLLPAPGSLHGQRVLVMGDGPDSGDWAIAALAEGKARAVVQVGDAPEKSSAGHGSAIAPIVRHSFRGLQPAQRAGLHAAAAVFSCTMPSDWARRLRAHDDQYRLVHVGKEASLSELLLGQGFNPDLVVVPGRPGSAHAACPVRTADGGLCELANLFRYFKVDECYRLTTSNGAVLPVIAFGTGAAPAAGPRAQDRFLARYGIVDVLETISCDFFVEDEGALFASFQEFRTSETFGGKLMETKP